MDPARGSSTAVGHRRGPYGATAPGTTCSDHLVAADANTRHVSLHSGRPPDTGTRTSPRPGAARRKQEGGRSGGFVISKNVAFLLDRVTGKPIYGVGTSRAAERSVPSETAKTRPSPPSRSRSQELVQCRVIATVHRARAACRN